MVLFKGIGDLIPLYALYSLLFAEHGLGTGQITSLFAIWSATAFLLEVPSGAWADTVSRRALLILSGILLTAGFALWTLVPTYLGFAAGFILWGTSGALVSGTFEALLYDELTARGEASAYPRILGYTRAASESAVVLGIVAATPLYLWGGYAVIGWSSVAFAAVHTLITFSLPSAPKSVSAADIDDLEDEAGEDDPLRSTPRLSNGAEIEPPADGSTKTAPVPADVVLAMARAGVTGAGLGAAARNSGDPVDGHALAGDGVAVSGCVASCCATSMGASATTGSAVASELAVSVHSVVDRPFARYLTMLKSGVGEAVRVRAVRNGVLLGALLFGVTAFDEYFALLAQEVGVSTAVVPLLVGVTVLGSLIGSVLAGQTEGMSGRTMGVAVGLGGVLFLGGAMVAGLALRSPGAVYVLAGVGFTAIGISYGIVYNAGVVAGARLQDAIEGPARATVTSVSGLLGEVVSFGVFGFAALATAWWSMSTTVAMFGVMMVAIAVVTPSWLPQREQE
ncbi:MFS transporter [Nocardia sp. NPDC052566]|uniref:MFS transporter n=1 Tax=Nocardia sp. NPDC052566 TaxID=3364330 RepID=UPI0037C7897A